jgi:hypothetical protein
MRSIMKRLCKVGVGPVLMLALGACGGQEPSGSKAEELATVESAALSIYGDLGSRTGARVMNTITCGASNQVTPYCASNSTAGERLYTWTAPYSGNFRINTFGSGFNTVLHIFDQYGTPLSWCNDNAGGTLQSEVTVSSGQKLIIAVDGAGSACGYFELNIYPN